MKFWGSGCVKFGVWGAWGLRVQAVRVGESLGLVGFRLVGSCRMSLAGYQACELTATSELSCRVRVS